jgi:hypothetical protein
MARQATKLTSFDRVDSNQKWPSRIESGAPPAADRTDACAGFFLGLIHVHMANKTRFGAEPLMADLV